MTEKMKLRKARKSDWEEYYKIKIEESEEYEKIIGRKINIPSKNKLKKEFEGFIENLDLIMFVIEVNQNLGGYINCKIHKSFWVKRGYIDDIFVLKEYRRRGCGGELINEFVNFLKKKKIKELELSVNPRNENAIRLYAKMGFEIAKYQMRKKLK
jgi:ribosomal protein S18 acetylase RimI-like enzyme